MLGARLHERLRSLSVGNGFPQTRSGVAAISTSDAERIEDRVDYDQRSAIHPRPPRLTPSGYCSGRQLGEGNFERRQVVSARQGLVDKRAAQTLPKATTTRGGGEPHGGIAGGAERPSLSWLPSPAAVRLGRPLQVLGSFPIPNAQSSQSMTSGLKRLRALRDGELADEIGGLEAASMR